MAQHQMNTEDHNSVKHFDAYLMIIKRHATYFDSGLIIFFKSVANNLNLLTNIITQTRPCNIQQYSTAVKNVNFQNFSDDYF